MRHIKTLNIAALGAALCLLSACNKTELNEETVKTLAVTGVGEVEVLPDRFVLSGAVIKQDGTAQAAMNDVADIVNAMQAAARDISVLTDSEFNFASVNSVGVKDPECLLFNQEADRTNATLRPGEPRVKKRVCEDQSQQASISFTFTGGPPEQAGTALSRFSQSGAIRLRLDGYRINNIDEIELQAGEIAVKNARDKADRLAAAAGASITGVLDLDSYQATYDQRAATAPRVNLSGAGETSALLDSGEPVEVTDLNLEAGPQIVSAAIELEFTYE